MNPLASLLLEFENAEQAASYDRWFRDKVKAALEDNGSSIPHDVVMQEMEAIIESAEKKPVTKPLP